MPFRRIARFPASCQKQDPVVFFFSVFLLLFFFLIWSPTSNELRGAQTQARCQNTETFPVIHTCAGHSLRYAHSNVNAASEKPGTNGDNGPPVMMCSKPRRCLFADLICPSCSVLLIARVQRARRLFVIVVVLWLFVWANYG